MLVVKTGMQAEYDAAHQVAASDVVVLTGTQTVADLQNNVPADCKAIISFGLCGGLGLWTKVGQSYIYDRVVTPNTTLWCDEAWRKRLIAATGFVERGCWSSGEFNTANNQEQRQQLFKQTGCTVIDDETRYVAEFAVERKIAHIGLRVVGDGAEDNLPPAVIDAVNADGTTNIFAVVTSLIKDPLQGTALIKTAGDYSNSLQVLRSVAQTIGPYFGWQQ